MAAIIKPMRRGNNRGSKADKAARDLANEYKRRIGDMVREHRERLELTQEELGKMLDMGHTAVSAFENGRSVISPTKYAAMGEALGLPKVEMGKFLLRYTNPWIYALIYGERSTELREELGTLKTDRDGKGSRL